MPLGIDLLVTALIAGGLGWLIGWWVGWRMGRKRIQACPPDVRLETELRRQLAKREAEVATKRDQLTKTMTSLATALANQGTATVETRVEGKITSVWRAVNTGGATGSPPPARLIPVPQRLHPHQPDQTVSGEPPAAAAGFGKPLFVEIK